MLLAEHLPFATTISGYIFSITSGLIIIFIGYAAKALTGLSRAVQMLTREVLGDKDTPSLRADVTTLKTDIAVIKHRGTRNPKVRRDNNDDD
jgi:hypothetical protein